MGTTVKPCDCTSEFQDKFYGKGRRLHNLSEDGKETRCTICGKRTRSDSKK